MNSAFPKGTEALRQLVKGVQIDFASLCLPLRTCELSKCRGTCCHDGVYVTGEEAEVVRELVAAKRSSLENLGANIPERPIVYGKFHDIASGPKTATRPAPMKQWVDDYPSHFEETNCVFLLSDAKCSLQTLAMEEGIDPWFYKPFTCWIHPLSFSKCPEGRDLLTLHTEDNDPHCFPDYDGFSSKTHCGRVCESGKAAYEALTPELTRLSEIGGRDIMAEIQTYVSK